MLSRDSGGDQARVGSVVVRTRSEVGAPRPELGEGDGAVFRTVALLSCHAALPEHAPLSSYLVPFRGGSESEGVWSGVESDERGNIVEKSRRDPKIARLPFAEDTKCLDACGWR